MSGYANPINQSITIFLFLTKIRYSSTSMRTPSTGKPMQSCAVIPLTSICWAWKCRNLILPAWICFIFTNQSTFPIFSGL